MVLTGVNVHRHNCIVDRIVRSLQNIGMRQQETERSETYCLSGRLVTGLQRLLLTVFERMAGTAVTALASRRGGICQKLDQVVVGVNSVFGQARALPLWEREFR